MRKGTRLSHNPGTKKGTFFLHAESGILKSVEVMIRNRWMETADVVAMRVVSRIYWFCSACV